MNLSTIQQAVRDGSEIEIKIDGVGTVRGVPRISWKKRQIVLSQANGCKNVVSFDDIEGF